MLVLVPAQMQLCIPNFAFMLEGSISSNINNTIAISFGNRMPKLWDHAELFDLVMSIPGILLPKLAPELIQPAGAGGLIHQV